ncbi:Protein of unknown function [Franzmannia pantelleriensis]|uniref:DUF3750 domain-containing protein n=1 Tax=Franzmannia pantelleriensis TaxID=48727 RepID=A0A1G9QNC8_9GAMM|nr:DUF3750 domain-containing protein [Halomonas pantelleriensis]SDM12473.1 Protein of unknown function [Halomonas pantelleriensis]
MKIMLRGMGAGLLMMALLLAGPLWMLASGAVPLDRHWSSADRSPAGLAPETSGTPVVQVYAARAFGWRGAFGVHTWIVTRAEGEEDFRLHHVLSWRRPTVVSGVDTPDRAWFGNPPTLLADYRGEAAAALVPLIDAAIADYPAPDRYRAWPGPNSNSFVAWVMREVPGFEVALPVTAVGRDYLFGEWWAPTTSGSGYQLALGGLFGISLARVEGLEITLLGLTFGVDVLRPALKLPGVGRLGMAPAVAGHDRRS